MYGEKNWYWGEVTDVLMVILLFSGLFAVAAVASPQHKKSVQSYKKGQQKPDPARIDQIGNALQERGYITGYPSPNWTWERLQEVTRRIANENGWQVDHAPDVRVLGCQLHLLGDNFDTDVCQMHDDLLDKDQRIEYFRKHPDSPLPH